MSVADGLSPHKAKAIKNGKVRAWPGINRKKDWTVVRDFIEN